jgi:hypothetical protein
VPGAEAAQSTLFCGNVVSDQVCRMIPFCLVIIVPQWVQVTAKSARLVSIDNGHFSLAAYACCVHCYLSSHCLQEHHVGARGSMSQHQVARFKRRQPVLHGWPVAGLESARPSRRRPPGSVVGRSCNSVCLFSYDCSSNLVISCRARL